MGTSSFLVFLKWNILEWLCLFLVPCSVTVICFSLAFVHSLSALRASAHLFAPTVIYKTPNWLMTLTCFYPALSISLQSSKVMFAKHSENSFSYHPAIGVHPFVGKPQEELPLVLKDPRSYGPARPKAFDVGPWPPQLRS